jgi:DNA (cytosine-5)-methyltransferase 1
MKILNLYACLGGNRYKWDEVTAVEVTAIELDPELARLYQERFPNDTVIVADAHKYLIDHYQEYNEGLIWASPPCPTHSRARYWGVGANGRDPKYPDLRLYEEIILLETHFKGKYVVENVIPYYEPLIPAKKRHRHLYWTNFNLPSVLSDRVFDGFCKRTTTNKYQGNELNDLCEWHEIDLSDYNGTQKKIKIARNLVDYVAGKTILETAIGVIKSNNNNQQSLF